MDICLQLSSVEEDFIFAAEFGDIPTVQRVLEENPNFSVDYSDILGRTPLRLAVGNEHLEVRQWKREGEGERGRGRGEGGEKSGREKGERECLEDGEAE